VDQIEVALMSGPQDGAVLTFERLLDSDEPTVISIGRREGSDVCLNYDSQVSREHAALICDRETFWLEDKQSTNGTYVGDEKITGRVQIEPGCSASGAPGCGSSRRPALSRSTPTICPSDAVSPAVPCPDATGAGAGRLDDAARAAGGRFRRGARAG